MKKLPKQVIILGIISLFTDMASEMLYPITPIFLSSVLGASMAVVGLIEGLAEVTAGVLKGYFGFLSDKLKKRSIFVVIGYSLSAISKPFPGLIPKVETVLFSRIFDRVGKGIRTAPRDALLSSYAENNSGAIFGFHRGMDTLGAVIGPLLALLLLSLLNNNFRLIFILSIIPSLFAVSSTFLVKNRIKEEVVKQKTREKIRYLKFWKDSPKSYRSVVILVTIFSLVNSSDVFLILKSKNISHSDTLAILGYVFYNLIYASFSYPAGILSDKVGKKKIYILGLVVFSTIYLGFAIFKSFWITWILFALYGIYASSTEGILKAWISDLVPNFKVASAIGLINMISSISLLLGSILAGVLWDQFGSSVPFYLSSVVSLIVALSLISVKEKPLAASN